jgi:chromosome segregation ATPase
MEQRVQDVTQKQEATLNQVQRTDKALAAVDEGIATVGDKVATVENKLAALDTKITTTERTIKRHVDKQLLSIEKVQQQQAAVLGNLQQEARTQTVMVQRNTGAVKQLEKTIKKTRFATPTKATVNERIRNEVSAQLRTVKQQQQAAEEKEDLMHKKKQLKKLLKEVLD